MQSSVVVAESLAAHLPPRRDREREGSRSQAYLRVVRRQRRTRLPVIGRLLGPLRSRPHSGMRIWMMIQCGRRRRQLGRRSRRRWRERRLGLYPSSHASTSHENPNRLNGCLVLLKSHNDGASSHMSLHETNWLICPNCRAKLAKGTRGWREGFEQGTCIRCNRYFDDKVEIEVAVRRRRTPSTLWTLVASTNLTAPSGA